MDKRFKLMLSMTTALLIVCFIVLGKSPSSNQHSEPSEQSSPIKELYSNSLQNKDIKKHAQEQKYIMSDDNTTSRGDGNSSWKQNELKKLSNLIQQRLHFVQNPPDCSKAKKIVCNFKERCGFGCQTHHLSFCMIMAYGTGRTLILESKGWDYAEEGWEKFFRPLSENCLDRKGETTGKWTSRYPGTGQFIGTANNDDDDDDENDNNQNNNKDNNENDNDDKDDNDNNNNNNSNNNNNNCDNINNNDNNESALS
ncbi:alpha-(1,6)-fucosyltransferase-like [Strongylocentrotus purpuratus]|uniref:GT23 domain-containing protein n=1 Tax=Strongylocentrotus purpuratus TaxID=7668 RepID=A0A7M7T1Y4_STRPU|nr:alpha-(1,6)-fucosyltransferase-like [Strongylocentrotus purpuratus]